MPSHESHIESIELELVKIKIDGKKLTASMLSQIPFMDLCRYIEGNEDIEGAPPEYHHLGICRINKMACVKNYKDWLRFTDEDYIGLHGNILESSTRQFFSKVSDMLLWETPEGELALHRLYKGRYTIPDKLSFSDSSKYREKWMQEIVRFATRSQMRPLVMIGV